MTWDWSLSSSTTPGVSIQLRLALADMLFTHPRPGRSRPPTACGLYVRPAVRRAGTRVRSRSAQPARNGHRVASRTGGGIPFPVPLRTSATGPRRLASNHDAGERLRAVSGHRSRRPARGHRQQPGLRGRRPRGPRTPGHGERHLRPARRRGRRRIPRRARTEPTVAGVRTRPPACDTARLRRRRRRLRPVRLPAVAVVVARRSAADGSRRGRRAVGLHRRAGAAGRRRSRTRARPRPHPSGPAAVDDRRGTAPRVRCRAGHPRRPDVALPAEQYPSGPRAVASSRRGRTVSARPPPSAPPGPSRHSACPRGRKAPEGAATAGTNRSRVDRPGKGWPARTVGASTTWSVASFPSRVTGTRPRQAPDARPPSSSDPGSLQPRGGAGIGHPTGSVGAIVRPSLAAEHVACLPASPRRGCPPRGAVPTHDRRDTRPLFRRRRRLATRECCRRACPSLGPLVVDLPRFSCRCLRRRPPSPEGWRGLPHGQRRSCSSIFGCATAW